MHFVCTWVCIQREGEKERQKQKTKEEIRSGREKGIQYQDHLNGDFV